MNVIKAKNILHQLKLDLIGKDSYRGVTFTYSWLANQFGHYALGYIPTLIAFSIIKRYASWSNPSFWAAIIISVIWFVFEVYNFLGPLLLQKKSATKFIYTPSKNKYIFLPSWGNIAFDTMTDLLFFWFGAFSAGLFLEASKLIVIVLIFLFLAFLYPAYYWFVTKMYLQYARFPIQFRLSQWQCRDEDSFPKQTVLSFIAECKNSTGHHFLIFGGRRSGKSTLGIGIGTELSIKRRPCSYYTCMKWLSLLSLNDADTLEAEDCDIWSWRTSSFLLIDDINPGNPITRNFISPADILEAINTEVTANRNTNKQDLTNKNVVWVLGEGASTSPDAWHEMLIEIGIQRVKIKVLDLGFRYM